MKGTTPSFKIFPDNEITFNYFPKKYLNSSLRLVSLTDQPLAFKIKTNVPICYLVKPHIGFIPPRSSMDITITMQPTDYNPQTASISDKFLVNIVSLPPNTDTAALADPARFQQIWDSVPKSLVQSHKLKVALKFETSGTNTGVTRKTDEDASKAAQAKDTPLDDSADQARRDESEKSSMMYSFADEDSNIGRNRYPTLEPIPQSLSQQILTANVGQNLSTIKEEDNERSKRELAAPKETPKTPAERVGLLEKRIDEMENEKRILNQKCQELTGKAEEQRRMLFELSEENTRLKSELSNLKSSTFKGKSSTREGQGDAGGYQMWHVLLAAIMALILGAYLSSS